MSNLLSLGRKKIFLWSCSATAALSLGSRAASAGVEGLGFLFEGSFAPFTQEAIPQPKGGVFLTSARRWEILADYDQMLARLDALTDRISAVSAADCKLSLKNIQQLSELLRSSRDRFVAMCMHQEQAPDCLSDGQRLHETRLSVLELSTSSEQACQAGRISPALLRLSEKKSARLFGAEATVGGGFKSYAFSNPALVDRSEPLPRAEWDLSLQRPDEFVSLAGVVETDEKAPAYQVRLDAKYRIRGDRVAAVAHARALSEAGRFTSDRSSIQRRHWAEGKFTAYKSWGGDSQIIGLSYAPGIQVTTAQAYGFISHAIELLLGKSDEQQEGFNGYFLRARKIYASSSSLLPSWQSALAGYRAQDLGLGGARIRLEAGLQETRDADAYVRLLPHFELEAKGPRASGLAAGTPTGAWMKKISHQSAAKAYWLFDPDYFAAVTTKLGAQASHRVFYGDRMSVEIAASLQVRDSMSARPAGRRAVKELSLGIEPAFQATPALHGYLKARMDRSVLTASTVSAASGSWTYPDSSYSLFYCELGMGYTF